MGNNILVHKLSSTAKWLFDKTKTGAKIALFSLALGGAMSCNEERQTPNDDLMTLHEQWRVRIPSLDDAPSVSMEEVSVQQKEWLKDTAWIVCDEEGNLIDKDIQYVVKLPVGACLNAGEVKYSKFYVKHNRIYLAENNSLKYKPIQHIGAYWDFEVYRDDSEMGIHSEKFHPAVVSNGIIYEIASWKKLWIYDGKNKYSADKNLERKACTLKNEFYSQRSSENLEKLEAISKLHLNH